MRRHKNVSQTETHKNETDKNVLQTKTHKNETIKVLQKRFSQKC